jgi:hypothetical protein
MRRIPIYERVKRVLLGAPRDLFDPKIFHNVSLIAFFAWQLVFQEENFFNKLLHNQTAFIAQKMLVFSGHPMIVMPIRVLE